MIRQLLSPVSSRLLCPWETQIKADDRPRQCRRHGMLTYRLGGTVIGGLVPIDQIEFVVLFDEPRRRKRPIIRLAGYSACRVPHGVLVGGREHCRFFKDLSLCPTLKGRGPRLKVERPKLLAMALDLDSVLKRISTAAKPPPHRNIVLPKVWAGFTPSWAAQLKADGPEVMRIAQGGRVSPGRLLPRNRLLHDGLALYPLEWVSHEIAAARQVYFDVGRFPRRQVFTVDCFPQALQGYRGAAEFDFYSSRYRSQSD